MENSQTSESSFNIEQIRQDALHSLSRGAVTADYPLDLEQACKLLNEALATEIVCVLRYRHVEERIAIEVYRNLISWFGMNDPTTRRILEKILADEEEHANDMADLLTKTDRRPDLNS